MDFNEILIMVGDTLLMTFVSTFFAYLIGLPLGVLINITKKNGLKPNKFLNFILGLIVNILRSIPCLIVIVICMPLTRLVFYKGGTGYWYSILIPLVVCAFAFTARMVEQSLDEVPAGEIEAIKSLGASNWQIITKVLLPEAKTSLITGACVVAINIIGYTAFALDIGAGGLITGIYNYYSENTTTFYGDWYFWLLIILVVVLVQLIQEGGLFLVKKIDKRRILK